MVNTTITTTTSLFSHSLRSLGSNSICVLTTAPNSTIQPRDEHTAITMAALQQAAGTAHGFTQHSYRVWQQMRYNQASESSLTANYSSSAHCISTGRIFSLQEMAQPQPPGIMEQLPLPYQMTEHFIPSVQALRTTAVNQDLVQQRLTELQQKHCHKLQVTLHIITILVNSVGQVLVLRKVKKEKN